MKVVLVKSNIWNPKQMVISLFTWSKVCHAALLFNNTYRLYDASESRGDVDYGKTLEQIKNQKIIVYDIPESEEAAKKYALLKRGTKYDWKGIMGWVPFFSSNDPQTVYCFELVLQTLLTMSHINGFATDRVAGDLRQKLFKKPIDSDDIFILLERCQLHPVFEGKAKDYLGKLLSER